MTTITTVTSKGSALTSTEMDTNLSNLNTYKLEDVDTRSTIKPTLNLDFANSKVLDPRITFTRASIATYYDGQTTVLAEQNLFKYSQDFTNAAWTRNIGPTGVTAAAAVAPDGTTTGQKLYSTTAGGFVYVGQTLGLANLVYTSSIYAKAADVNFMLIQLYDGLTNPRAWFNLSTGIITTVNAGLTATMTSVGNGWYRCSIASTRTAGFSTNYQPCDADSTSNTIATIGQGIYIWGAQLEQRSFVTSYNPTTTSLITNYVPVIQTANSNIGRLDSDPITGVSNGLLLERINTNLMLYSGDLTNSNYIKTNITVTSGSTVGPDGSNAAVKLVNTSAAYGFIYQTVTVTSAFNMCYSIHLKSAELTSARVEVVCGPNSAYVDVNLSTGTVGSVVSSGLTATAGITAVGNGWYRVSFIYLSTGPTASHFIYSPVVGTGYAGFYAWGTQLERDYDASNYTWMSSYIPTTSASATRNWEYAQITGTSFSSFFNNIAGTFYGEALSRPASATYGASVLFNVCNSAGGMFSNLSVYQLYLNNSASRPQFTTTDTYGNSNTDLQNVPSLITANQLNKVAVTYALNNFGISCNGYTANQLNTAKLGMPNQLALGSNFGGQLYINGTIRKFMYYPARLTNAQLQVLTT